MKIKILNEQGLNAVISVYDGVRPSHIVLGELYDWAETNNQDVKKLIEKLSVPNDVERE